MPDRWIFSDHARRRYLERFWRPKVEPDLAEAIVWHRLAGDVDRALKRRLDESVDWTPPDGPMVDGSRLLRQADAVFLVKSAGPDGVWNVVTVIEAAVLEASSAGMLLQVEAARLDKLDGNPRPLERDRSRGEEDAA